MDLIESLGALGYISSFSFWTMQSIMLICCRSIAVEDIGPSLRLAAVSYGAGSPIVREGRTATWDFVWYK